MISASPEFRQLLVETFGGEKVDNSHNEFAILKTSASDLLATLDKLKGNPFSMEQLSTIAAVDYLDRGVFEVVYILYSLSKPEHRIKVKVETPRENPSLPSIVSLWLGADFQEREIYDLFGINFEGHPNMTRIFLPTDFPNHPYRKDIPLYKDKEYLTKEDWPIPPVFGQL